MNTAVLTARAGQFKTRISATIIRREEERRLPRLLGPWRPGWAPHQRPRGAPAPPGAALPRPEPLAPLCSPVPGRGQGREQTPARPPPPTPGPAGPAAAPAFPELFYLEGHTVLRVSCRSVTLKELGRRFETAIPTRSVFLG